MVVGSPSTPLPPHTHTLNMCSYMLTGPGALRLHQPASPGPYREAVLGEANSHILALLANIQKGTKPWAKHRSRLLFQTSWRGCGWMTLKIKQNQTSSLPPRWPHSGPSLGSLGWRLSGRREMTSCPGRDCPVPCGIVCNRLIIPGPNGAVKRLRPSSLCDSAGDRVSCGVLRIPIQGSSSSLFPGLPYAACAQKICLKHG